MAKAKQAKRFVGVDVGGTKILAALVAPSGAVLARKRRSTPRGGTGRDIVRAIADLIAELLDKAQVAPNGVAALGLAIPGVVDPGAGRVVVTPNMRLTGVDIVPAIRRRIDVPVALGNDVNLGTLGEKWLGAAREARSVVGVFIGTGIGGGVIVDGRLVRGVRETAGEIGHMVMEIGGPKCGCGGRGCFEALASRTAIERDIRAAVKSGRESIVTDLLGNKAGPIRSGVLKQALAEKDAVVTEVTRRASEAIGFACLTIRHLLDPEAIVLGGGVVEACGGFVLPIVESVLEGDPLRGARAGGRLLESALGDDAVALGAAALAQQSIGADPFRHAREEPGTYPAIRWAGPRAGGTAGEVRIGEKTYATDVYVRVDGKPRKRKKSDAAAGEAAGPREIDSGTLAKVCKGGPWVLFLGAGGGKAPRLTPEARDLVRRRAIDVRPLPLAEALGAYRRCGQRKAILLMPGL